jgi:hypothetical protein
MNDINETWIKLSPAQVENFFHIPKTLAEKPRNLFWGKRRVITAERVFADERMELMVYLHDEDNRGEIYILEREGYLNKRRDVNPLRGSEWGIYTRLRLSKKELIDSIAIFEEILAQFIPEVFVSFLSALHDYEDPSQPSSTETSYYLSSYEKKVLKKPLMGAFYYSKYKTLTEISIGIGHFYFAGEVPISGRLQGEPRPGMCVNYSVLGVMIELLKQQVPFLAE